MELNKDDILLLIQEFQSHRILWDAKDKWHYNKLKKQNAWEEIAQKLNISVECARKKMDSLLGSFRRERSKGKKSLGTGKGAEEVYKSEWYAFKSFTFLLDKDNPKETINSILINNEDSVHDVNENWNSANSPDVQFVPFSQNVHNSENEDIEQVIILPTTSYETSPQVSINQRERRAPKRNRKEELEDPRIQKAFEILQQPEDPTAKYTSYLADKLNQFEPRKKAMLIHEINELIFKAEMEEYNSPLSSTSTITE